MRGDVVVGDESFQGILYSMAKSPGSKGLRWRKTRNLIGNAHPGLTPVPNLAQQTFAKGTYFPFANKILL